MLSRFIGRYLDPSESLLEILFGLIMALTLTVGARLLPPGEIRPLELAAALAGCNVAWGIIDAVFYLLGSLFNRNRRVQFARRLQATTDKARAIALIREEFALEGEPPMRAEDTAAFHKSLLEMLRHADTARARFTANDWAAARIILVLVSATAVPGLMPLLVMDDTGLALRVANAIQVVLLFGVGYRWAHYSGANPWRTATVVCLMGVVLVLIAVALGG
ncbi:VIT family protein [Rhodospirillales bacterium URHD0017]|nr:VIT family protein [Rhodospirillales bacterium URHD0017]